MIFVCAQFQIQKHACTYVHTHTHTRERVRDRQAETANQKDREKEITPLHPKLTEVNVSCVSCMVAILFQWKRWKILMRVGLCRVPDG